MRVLVDVSHPALAHVFGHVVPALAARGHECRVVGRDKDVTLALLAAYGVPYQVYGRAGRSQGGRLRELVVREAGILRLARRFRPHLVTGTSVHAARVARLCGARSAVLNDDDAAAVPFFRWLAYPLAHAILTPAVLAHERHGARHLTYPSYHALFYLHPARFRPDPAVRGALGLAEGEPFALVRLSALQAHHDRGVRGVDDALLRALVGRLRSRLRVFLSSERPLQGDLEALRVALPPERLHHALAHAELVVGDSQTMTAEAAVLGTPALRLNDFVGRISYLRDLEARGLAFGFRPGEEARLLQEAGRLLDMPDRRAVFAERRARMLAERIDPLPWLLDRYEEIAGGAAPHPGG